MVPTSKSNNNGFIRPCPASVLPPWMAGGPSSTAPSVMLTLSPSPWPPHNNHNNNNNAAGEEEVAVFSELVECCRELEEGQRAWAAHRKEAAWRLKRVELQLESEKACRRREKMEEIEFKVRALRDEEKAALDRIEGDYREQLAGLRREAEGKDQKLAEQWAARHSRLTKFLDQMGCRSGELNNNFGVGRSD